MATTTNYGLALHEGTDTPGAAFRQDNTNMQAVDAALAALSGQVSAAGMPVGSTLVMATQTNPATAGAPGTWTYLFRFQYALASTSFFYLYKRTA